MRLRELMSLLVQAAIVIMFVMMVSVSLFEWFVGCGEHYVDAHGITHVNACVFVK